MKSGRKYSISQQYLFFVFFAPLVLLLITIIAAWSIYYTSLKEKVDYYADAADKIAIILDTGFNYIAQFAKVIGQQIIELDHIDAESVEAILKSNITTATIIQDVFNFNLFDFTNPEGFVVASTTRGSITHSPLVKKANRSWIALAPKQPWQLHVSDPDLSLLNRTDIPTRIIPAGYGITDKKGKFVGTISTGYELSTLSRNIIHGLHAHDISFVLMTDKFKIITQSFVQTSQEDVDQLVGSLKKAKLQNKEQGELASKIVYGNSTYRFYQKVPHYNYIILIGESNHYLEREFKESVLPEMVQTFVTGMFLLLLLYFFRTKIVGPIMDLSIAADRISQGEQNITIPDGNSVEIDNLSKQLKKVVKYTEDLLSSRVALQEAHVKLTERTLELEKALQARTEFLNNMSHEIKTPVHGVINFADMLVSDWSNMSETDRLDYASKIQKNSDRLFSLVSNLLDLSQLGVSKMQFVMEEYDLLELVEDVIEEMEPLYLGRKDLKVSLILADTALVTRTCFDKERIAQVVRNLISNSIKFTKCGIIEVSIEDSVIKYEDSTEVAALLLSVKDEGVGIPESELGEIFDAFSQSSRTKTKAGGTGLGLSICLEIIAVHKGQIWAQNNSNKQGANISFTLPSILQLTDIASNDTSF